MEGVDWIYLPREGDRWRPFVNTVMKFLLLRKAGCQLRQRTVSIFKMDSAREISLLVIITSSRGRRVGHTARMEEAKNSYSILVRKSDGVGPLGISGSCCSIILR